MFTNTPKVCTPLSNVHQSLVQHHAVGTCMYIYTCKWHTNLMEIQPQKHMVHSTDWAHGRVSSESIVLKKKCTSSCLYVKLLSLYSTTASSDSRVLKKGKAPAADHCCWETNSMLSSAWKLSSESASSSEWKLSSESASPSSSARIYPQPENYPLTNIIHWINISIIISMNLSSESTFSLLSAKSAQFVNSESTSLTLSAE